MGKDAFWTAIQKLATIFQGLFKNYSRATLDFQGPPTTCRKQSQY